MGKRQNASQQTSLYTPRTPVAHAVLYCSHSNAELWRAAGAPTEAHTVPRVHELPLLASYVGWGLVFGLLSPFYFVWLGVCFSFTKRLLTTFSVTSTVLGPGENTENKIN